MASSTQCLPSVCIKPLQCEVGDPPAVFPEPYHADLQSCTHSVLQVCEPPDAGPVCVRVVDGSTGAQVEVVLHRKDSVAVLKQQLRKVPGPWYACAPDNLHLACNGKPVRDEQLLRDLHLGKCALFVSYRKCVGG